MMAEDIHVQYRKTTDFRSTDSQSIVKKFELGVPILGSADKNIY